MRIVLGSIFAVAFAASAAPAAHDGQAVAVIDLRTRVPGVDVASLGDQIRDVAMRTIPEARILSREETPSRGAVGAACAAECEAKAALAAGADLVAGGELLRVEDGFLVSLELRETRSGKLVSTASAAGGTTEELTEAVASAAVDLFRPRRAAAAIAIGPAALPEVPAASMPVQEGGALNLDVDANVLVAYDEARTVEARGKERPEEAAAAWRAVAELGGENPFREVAATRAGQWQRYAEGKRAFEAQLARDTSRLRKVLPLGSVTDATKIELIVRYARVYGAEKAPALIAVMAAGLRERAGLAVGCEARQADKCVALARAADDAKDPKAALDYLDRACGAEAADACAEAGDRWLRIETRDVSRAIPALQRGCNAGNGVACARLARVYEEGDGTDANISLAADLRDKACTAGDGKSCRRLACGADGNPVLAAELWQKGCAHGDTISCALADAARAPAGPRRQMQEAMVAAGARPASTAGVSPPAPGEKPAAPTAATPAATARRDKSAGFALLGFAAVAAGGAAILAFHDPDVYRYRYGGRYVVQSVGEPRRTIFPVVLGAAAVLSAGTGIAILLSRPEPDKPQLSLAVAPSGLAISGTLP